MVVNSVYSLDQEELNERLIGIKKVPGGGLQDSEFVDGVAFKKTVSYRRGWTSVCIDVNPPGDSSRTPVSNNSRSCSMTPRLSA